MTELTLPPRSGDNGALSLPPSRQVSLIGGNGAGKTRFMEELIRLCGGRSYVLSALSASFPEREPSALKGSIDDIYENALHTRPYLKDDALSELDKLSYLLYTDEFEALLTQKQHYRKTGRQRGEGQPTRFDLLAGIWERIFPDRHVSLHTNKLTFTNESGDDEITVDRLSQGEKTVLYYVAATLYAMEDAVIFIDSPALFIHPAILNNVWNMIEDLRPDCTFVYSSVDVDFVSSRTDNVCIWIKSYDADSRSWDYELLDPDSASNEMIDLAGARKPVLFIEGDAAHSIDARLYGLVFSDYTVKPLGSCNKVIESTRTFNDLRPMHHLDSHGIVDRDRRTDAEVDYLRRKNIFVPEVAEVENIFLTEEVIRLMASFRGKNPDRVFARVSKVVMQTFRQHLDEQALLHVRHKVKRDVECKIDARFQCITAMETHLRGLVDQLEPRKHYNRLRQEFHAMLAGDDYAGVLRVFNHKPMLADSNVASLLGYPNKDAYIAGVLKVLKSSGHEARCLKASIKYCFGLRMDDTPVSPVAEAGEGSASAEKPAQKIKKSQRGGRNRRRPSYRKV